MGTKILTGQSRVQGWIVLSNLTLLFVMIVVFSSISPQFLSARGLIAVELYLAPILLLAVGETFVLMARSFDLSIGSLFTLTSVLTAFYVGQLGPAALLIGPVTGTLFGLINGVTFKFGRIPSFIATLATMIIYQGLAQIVTQGQYYIFATQQNFRALAIYFVAGVVPLMVVWALVISVVCIFIALRTKFGRVIYSIGANYEATRMAGINTTRYQIAVFAISGCLAGFAGALAAAQQGGASALPTDILLPAIAAATIAGTPITGGAGGPHRALLGAAMLAVLTTGLNVSAVETNLQVLIFGIVVIAAVYLTTNRKLTRFIR
jgi:ribose/xylose/arabinose/galactoside ABC-type transport system permease subunit